MATILAKINHVEHSVLRSIWELMGGADVGSPDQLARYPEHSVQMGSGTVATPGNTFGGATVVLQGSDDGITWFTLKDVTGATVSATSAARFDVKDVPKNTRPSTSGGTNSSVTVIITSRSFGR
jgi:hypothetical protein